jgi:xeroderma pigmentosum group C-complementing protein
MAMQATAAEHEARQQAGVTATVSAFSNQASGKEGSPARSSSAGRAQSAAPALLRGARSSRGRLASGQGPHIAVNQVQVSMCWAEVWCGSAEYGRWVAVDVAGQQVDRWVPWTC